MSHIPQRTCIGCRAVAPAKELVCLIAPGGQVRVARRGRAQAADESTARGRGGWVHPDCLAAALKGGALGRAFRAKVEVSAVSVVSAVSAVSAVSDRRALLAAAHIALGRSTDVQGN